MSAQFVTEPLGAHHDRASFSCGNERLDRYLVAQAGQDVRRKIANCFVACEPGVTVIAGYYTFSAASIALNELDDALQRRLPRYQQVPAALIGRLAVDRRYQSRELGSALLIDAAERAAHSDAAVYALLVDAKDEQAAAFYRKHEFIPFAGRPNSLFLPLATARK